MKLMCALSVTVRLAGFAFFFGLAVGLVLGFRAADGPLIPDRAPAAETSLLTTGAPPPSISLLDPGSVPRPTSGG